LKAGAILSDDEDVLAEIDEVLQNIETLESEYSSSFDRGYDFLEDVREKLQSMRKSIEQRGTYTQKQLNAVRGWGEGVLRWFPSWDE